MQLSFRKHCQSMSIMQPKFNRFYEIKVVAHVDYSSA